MHNTLSTKRVLFALSSFVVFVLVVVGYILVMDKDPIGRIYHFQLVLDYSANQILSFSLSTFFISLLSFFVTFHSPKQTKTVLTVCGYLLLVPAFLGLICSIGIVFQARFSWFELLFLRQNEIARIVLLSVFPSISAVMIYIGGIKD